MKKLKKHIVNQTQFLSYLIWNTK